MIRNPQTKPSTGHVFTSSLSPSFFHLSLLPSLSSPDLPFLCPLAQQNAFRLQEARAQVWALFLPAISMLGSQSKFPLGCPRTRWNVSFGGKCKQLPIEELASCFPHSILLTLLSVLASACPFCEWGQKRRPHRTRLLEPWSRGWGYSCLSIPKPIDVKSWNQRQGLAHISGSEMHSFSSKKNAQFTLWLGELVLCNNICSELSSFGSLQTTHHRILGPANTIIIQAFHNASQPLGGELLTSTRCCMSSAVDLALWNS